MCLAGRIAHDEDAIAIPRANPRLNDAGREPRTIENRAVEHGPQYRTRFKNMSKHRLTSRDARRAMKSLEPMPPNAARQAGSPAIAMHHPAVTVLKRQQ